MTTQKQTEAETYMREIVDDPAKLQNFFDTTAKQLSNRVAQGNEPIRQIMQVLLAELLPSRQELIDQVSESPIERLFLSSLNFGGVLYGPGLLDFIEPCDDIEEQMDFFEQEYSAYQEICDYYGLKDEGVVFPQVMEELSSQGAIDEQQSGLIHNFFVFYDTFGLKDGFHITLQAGLPKHIKIDGRNPRVDMLVWRPFRRDFRLVIECDGFEWHKDRESFMHDRKRDRVLKSFGYDVIRFSGPEIYASPIATASELLKLLLDIQEREGAGESA